MNMLSGIIILNEKDLYSAKEMGMLVLYSMLCVLGIAIIAKKPRCPCAKTKRVTEHFEGQDMACSFISASSSNILEVYLKYKTDLKHIDKKEKRSITNILRAFEKHDEYKSLD